MIFYCYFTFNNLIHIISLSIKFDKATPMEFDYVSILLLQTENSYRVPFFDVFILLNCKLLESSLTKVFLYLYSYK